MNKNIKSDLLAIGLLALKILNLVYVLQILDLFLKRDYVTTFWLGILFIVYVFDFKNKIINELGNLHTR